MKKLNRAFIKGTNWALSGLISLLGISACDSDSEYDPSPVEYGTPHAHFIVSGKVTDVQGNGLEGIQVVVPSVDYHQKATSGFYPTWPIITEECKDTLYTNANGTFKYTHIGTATNDSINVRMKFEDVSENPQFETDSTKVTFFYSELKNGSGWNEGSAEKEMQIALRNKENENKKSE